MMMPVCFLCFSFQCHSALTRGGRGGGQRKQVWTCLINWYRKLQATTWIACPICSSLERSDLNHWWDLIEPHSWALSTLPCLALSPGPCPAAPHTADDHQENSAHDLRGGGNGRRSHSARQYCAQVPYLSWRPRTSRRGDRALSSQSHPFKSGWLDIILWVKKLV